MMSLHLTHPIYAGSFLLLGCLYMLVQKVRCPSRRVPSKLEGLPAGIRLGVLSLLLISLSGIQIVRTQPWAAVVFVLDLSESIAPQDKVAAFEYLKRATGTMRDDDTFGLVVFGKDAAIDQAFGPRRPLTAIQARPITTGTNIAQALHLAIAMLASQPQKRIVLLSDGNQTAGDTLRAAALAAAQGIPIDVVPLNTAWQEAGQGISIEATTAPEQIRVGEPFDVTVVLQGNTPTPVVLKLYRGGVAVAEREAVLTQGGRQTLHFPQRLDTAGFHHYTSVVERRDHTLPQHNEGGTVIYAYGRPRILYVTHAFTPPVLRDVLVKHDFEVLVSTPSLLPTSASALSPYDVVIFDNVAATTLTEKRMQALADYVETLGGGFIMLGSTQSFGPGGYGQTPLERILPVDVHVRSRVARPPLALVLLLDKSGSMATEEGHSTKIDVAKDAVQALLEVLDPADVLGIIAFDQDARPIMELQQLADKAIVQERLRPIQAGGGTAVYPALAMAYQWLQQSGAPRKHLLLLSDGQTAAGDVPALIRQFVDAQIVLSVVGIGPDADRAFLQELAAMGNGRSYFADAMAELPALFRREGVLLGGKWLIERRFTPHVVTDHEMLAGLNMLTFPTLAGYVASTPKPHATVLLASDSQEPILACWRFGLGKTLVFTSDLASSWTADWLQWPFFGTLWAHIVRWTGRRQPYDRLHPHVSFAGETATLTVEAFETDGRFINGLDMRATIYDPSTTRQEIRLVQTASGRYEGPFEVRHPGAYLLGVLASAGDSTLDYALHFGFHIPTLPEYRASRTNLALLNDIVGITKGATLANTESPFRHRGVGTTFLDIWPLTAALALVLFVVEVAVRRGFQLRLLRGESIREDA